MNVKKLVDHYFVKLPFKVAIISVKCFLITALIASLLFAVLWLTGGYVRLESMFNLGYNSPLIWGPMVIALALMIWSLVRGLFRLHKRTRKKKRSDFKKVMSEIYADAK